MWINLTTIEIASGFYGQGSRFRSGGNQLVPLVDVANGAAIGHHITGEFPLAAQDFAEQYFAGAARLAIRPVVGAHYRESFPLHHACFKCRQVGFPQIALIHHRVEFVAFRLRPAVNRKVLGCGNNFEITGIISLQALHKSDSHPGSQVRIFAVGLLPPAPARVAENIDVWRPKGQPFVNPPLVMPEKFMMLGAGFIRDDCRHTKHEIGVPGGGQAN